LAIVWTPPVSTTPLSTSTTPSGRFIDATKRQLQPGRVRIVHGLWNFIIGRGSYELPAA